LSQQDAVLVDYILALGVLFLIPYVELTLEIGSAERSAAAALLIQDE
jgi:hypothetical protein